MSALQNEMEKRLNILAARSPPPYNPVGALLTVAVPSSGPVVLIFSRYTNDSERG